MGEINKKLHAQLFSFINNAAGFGRSLWESKRNVLSLPLPLQGRMGAGASMTDYASAVQNSDAASFPAPFAGVRAGVEEKQKAGGDEASVLAYATEECARLKLDVHLDTEYSSATGRGRLRVTDRKSVV